MWYSLYGIFGFCILECKWQWKEEKGVEQTSEKAIFQIGPLYNWDIWSGYTNRVVHYFDFHSPKKQLSFVEAVNVWIGKTGIYLV